MSGQMGKALIVGGSSGIGLAVAKELMRRGWHAVILHRQQADPSLADYAGQYSEICTDLRYFDRALFTELAADEGFGCLVLTAGFGRVAPLEALQPEELEQLMQVNGTACMEILRLFYERIRGEEPFFCAVMGSIAGHISSPLFSGYAASKAALCRFAESVNAELDAAGRPNRILEVSPGHVAGTRFDGAAANDPAATAPLAAEIAARMFGRETLYIPQYDEVYKGVIGRYQADPAAFGRSSAEYKMVSGRVSGGKKPVVGYLSGTFDLFHIGHLNLLRRAKAHCDILIVGVHPDARHKGKETFIPFEERKEILRSICYVDRVVDSCPEDSDAWPLWHYDRLFVGSDYKGTERFARYEAYFADKGVEIVYFPYTSGTSSTQIRALIEMKTSIGNATVNHDEHTGS